MKIFYSEKYIAENCQPTDTFQKSQWIAASLVSNPIRGLEIVEPEPLTTEQIAYAHGAGYIASVASQQGLWTSVIHSNGGLVAAVKEALQYGVSGTLSSGLHHARRDYGSGFCTFNGLAITAIEATKMGLTSVLIVDVDAHCGGGTASLIAAYPMINQIDVSTAAFDAYEPDLPGRLELVKRADAYLTTFHDLLEYADGLKPELIIYNAGMDCHEEDTVGGLPGVDVEMIKQRESLMFDWCADRKIPIAFTIAGGYAKNTADRQRVTRLHRITLDTAREYSGG